MQPSFCHRAIQPLLRTGIIKKDKHKHLLLDYKTHHETIIFAESLRKDAFLEEHKDLYLFTDEILTKMKEDCFVLLVFGSAVNSKAPRDIDILLIVDNAERIPFNEKFLHNVASGYDLPLDLNVIGQESVYEMLRNREENNLLNEVLRKHIILYGAELFYRLLSRGR